MRQEIANPSATNDFQKGLEEDGRDADKPKEGPRGGNYDPHKWPALRSKFADVVALDQGDPSHLRLVLDADCRRRLAEARDVKGWGRNVLVFGGNGFVGAHLLHRLLADERVRRVYALARPRGKRSGRDRIAAAWKTFEIDDRDLPTDKLTVLEGTVVEPRFGLCAADYSRLALEVDTVFQCAGKTYYSIPYLEYRDDWVLGLLGVVQFCLEARVKQLSYIGSTIVHLFGGPEDFARPDSWWYSGYGQMKWINQNLLRGLAEDGLRTQVCEAPYILGSTAAGRDRGYVYVFWRILTLANQFGLAWDGDFLDFVPVDLLVEATVHNALSETPLPVIRPLYHDRLRIAEIAPLLGCKVVSWEEFYEAVKRFATPRQLEKLPVNLPELIGKATLPPIFPPGFNVGRTAPAYELMKFYLEKMGII